MQDKNKVSLNIKTPNKNSFKQAMERVEQDFRSNTLEKTLERLGINPDCLSHSFKEELKEQTESGSVIYGSIPKENKTHYGSGVILGELESIIEKNIKN